MRSSLLKGLAVALLLAAVLVPTAAAKPSHHHRAAVKLDRVPIPKVRLGAAVAGLKLTYSSGRSTGAAELSYGSLFLDNPGLDLVDTGVGEYPTARAAKRGLVSGLKGFLQFLGENFTQLNVTSTVAPLTVPAIGDKHWALIRSVSVSGVNSLYFAMEAFSDGKYVLDVLVAGGSQDLVTSYLTSKARVLDKRLHLAFSGRLHGHPVAPPNLPHLGPPSSGPDPAKAVLQTSDLPGSTIDSGGYGHFSGALSAYGVTFQPAGPYDEALQDVMVMPSTNSAAFSAAFIAAEEIESLVHGADETVTPVDVSAAGDEAEAVIVSPSSPDSTVDVAVVALHSGSVADVVLVAKEGPIDSAAVQTLAQTAATRLDAALT